MLTGILIGVFTGIAMIVSVLITRSLTTLVHEFGHAIPALLLTNSPVTVYVGNYGKVDKSMVFHTGRLTTYFSFNILNWNAGMCQHGGTNNILKSMLITLGGPIASVLLSIPLIYWFLQPDTPEIWKFVIPIFVLSAVYDFFVNIIPMQKPIKLEDGSLIHNDGYTLKLYWNAMTKPEPYLNGLNFFYEKKYSESYQEFHKLIDKNIHNRFAYETMLTCLLEQKEYTKAVGLMEDFEVHFQLKARNYGLLGKLHLRLKNYDSALSFLNKALHLDYNDVESLNARGRAFIELKEFQEATFDLNNAIRLKSDFADAYANRGLLHLRTYQREAADWDLQKALELDEKNALAHLHLGWFYAEKGDFVSNKAALEYFQKASALGVDENMDWIMRLRVILSDYFLKTFFCKRPNSV